MSGLHFAEPHWIHLLWVVLGFVALLAWLERRGKNAMEQLVKTSSLVVLHSPQPKNLVDDSLT